ncbi:hypothetical protein O9992_17230 [Vibrio lentus]|nr:hypothetical protein [Vibrio lentus]
MTLITRRSDWIGDQEGLEDFLITALSLKTLGGVVELTKVQTNLLTNLSYWVAKKL